jgi:transcriptional regulator with XRE-family HTH domain
MRDADPAPDFADLLTQARKKKGWSQEELETRSGVSRATISRAERRLTDNPESDHVRALCQALDIDPRDAAVSLGYLTLDEIQPARPLPPKMQQVLEILEDPRITDDDKQRWIDYLVYLRSKSATNVD